MNIALCIFYWVNKHFRFRFRFYRRLEGRVPTLGDMSLRKKYNTASVRMFDYLQLVHS